MRRIEFLGVPMDVASIQETVALVADKMGHSRFTQHVVVNVAKLVHMQRDQALSASVKACDLINIDGMGVVWGARFLGHEVPERVAGIDLFYALLEMSAARGFPVYFLGAREDVVAQAVAKMKLRHPNLMVAGWHHGYFWQDEAAVVEKIRHSGARLLFVAITSPRKENFIHRWRDVLGVDFVMGVGGTFDVVAGKVKRAPVWAQRAGLEWLYRMLQEPRRMWRRYLYTNSAFAWLLLREKLRGGFRRNTLR
ncbi:WecB/TagA/CpsF family glycosyltransferase [Microbulbifer bruguierae]|uniref:WecB/TagA/CpsF family glycosyltransferase n=1 Tax=Microbulbifer bruguierae TaxID=3029061 RepID=A0ABY8NKK2_9GAMM|nr:WecB/TagA/CpsF family glycosyltransferase [Microbulbifer bruguierae]WGL18242.1 WecB/TagA/CpsF family glycosyltransferase [Microbulbifer bruguierae]